MRHNKISTEIQTGQVIPPGPGDLLGLGSISQEIRLSQRQEEENETSRNQNQALRAIAMESSDLYSSCRSVYGILCEQARLSKNTTVESIIRERLAETQRQVKEELLRQQGGQQESSEYVSSHVPIDGRAKSRSNGKGVRAPARLNVGSIVKKV
jgi:hypothetical protein